MVCVDGGNGWGGLGWDDALRGGRVDAWMRGHVRVWGSLKHLSAHMCTCAHLRSIMISMFNLVIS
jgi:hypothetical protein